MLPSKLKRHLENTHPSVVSKSHDYFSRKIKALNQQKQASISSSALPASYKVAHRIAKCKKSHKITELILPVAVDMVNST
jgi:hypothetical protein